MKNITAILSLVIICTTITSCQKDNPYLIADNQVGPITNTTKISELESLFIDDSIVKPSLNNRFKASGSDILIYKNGKLSLKIQPRTYADTSSTIAEIQIIDPKYTTAEGLNSKSNYKTLNENYSLKNIQNSFKNIIVDIEDLGIYVIIEKSELPSNLKYDRDSKITKTQIPDQAQFKYFWFSFDEPTTDQNYDK